MTTLPTLRYARYITSVEVVMMVTTLRAIQTISSDNQICQLHHQEMLGTWIYLKPTLMVTSMKSQTLINIWHVAKLNLTVVKS